MSECKNTIICVLWGVCVLKEDSKDVSSMLTAPSRLSMGVNHHQELKTWGSATPESAHLQPLHWQRITCGVVVSCLKSFAGCSHIEAVSVGFGYHYGRDPRREDTHERLEGS